MSFGNPYPYGTAGGDENVATAQNPPVYRVAQGNSVIVFLHVNGRLAERLRENVEDVVRVLGLTGTVLVAIIVREEGVVRDANASDLDFQDGLTVTQIAPGVVTIGIGPGEIVTSMIDSLAVTLANMAAGSVDSSKVVDGSLLHTDLDPTVVPVGMVVPFAGITEPNGWLFCNGQEVTRVSPLGVVLGGRFGNGNGTTTYNVPDLRSRFPFGIDSGQPANDAVGETGGARTVTLTGAESGVPVHQHTAGTLGLSGGGYHEHYYKSEFGGNAAAGINIPVYRPDLTGTVTTTGGGAHSHTVTGATANTAAANAASAHENLPPFLTMNYLIRT